VPGQSASAGFGFGNTFGQPEQVEQPPERKLRLPLLSQKRVGPRPARRTGHREAVGLDGLRDGVEAVEQAASLGHKLDMRPLQIERAVRPGNEPGSSASWGEPWRAHRTIMQQLLPGMKGQTGHSRAGAGRHGLHPIQGSSLIYHSEVTSRSRPPRRSRNKDNRYLTWITEESQAPIHLLKRTVRIAVPPPLIGRLKEQFDG
jgi:hypothetical protein